jgi:hypothetical protein
MAGILCRERVSATGIGPRVILPRKVLRFRVVAMGRTAEMI